MGLTGVTICAGSIVKRAGGTAGAVCAQSVKLAPSATAAMTPRRVLRIVRHRQKSAQGGRRIKHSRGGGFNQGRLSFASRRTRTFTAAGPADCKGKLTPSARTNQESLLLPGGMSSRRGVADPSAAARRVRKRADETRGTSGNGPAHVTGIEELLVERDRQCSGLNDRPRGCRDGHGCRLTGGGSDVRSRAAGEKAQADSCGTDQRQQLQAAAFAPPQ